MNDVYFSPSLMCMDITDTVNQLKAFEQYCQMLHVDVMDGHFAKNITLSAGFVKTIRSHTNIPIDCHLMVEHPEDFIEQFAEAGADIISVHAETIQNKAFRELRKIENLGKKIGIVLCPATPVSAVTSYLDMVDLLTVMTVEVGYAGQVFIPEMLEKIAEAERLRKEKKYKYTIQADGAVGPRTYKQLYTAGARALVMGSSGLFNGEDSITDKCIRMHREFEEALKIC